MSQGEYKKKHRHSPRAGIIKQCRDVIKLLNIHLNHFPKHEKYGLQQQMRNTAYEMYALIIECEKRYHNKTSLGRLDVVHEQLRMFVHLAWELDYYHYRDRQKNCSDTEALRRLEGFNRLHDELGAMIGGWIKSIRA